MTAALAALLMFVAAAPDLLRPRPRGRVVRLRRPQAAAAARLGALVRRHKGRAEQADAIPQALELVARALRSGASVLTALDAVAVEIPEIELGEVVGRVRGGLTLAAALDGWVGEERERQTAAALLILGHSSGAAMAASLDRAAASLRQRRALADEIRALTSQTRASGAVVGTAPAGFALVVATVDHDALSALVSVPVGLVSLVTGLLLEGLGLWWMSRLCRGVLRWA